MRTRARLVALAFVAVVVAATFATMALAQPKKPRTPANKRPRTPTTAPAGILKDAGARGPDEAETTASEASSSDAGAGGATVESASSSALPSAPTVNDAGVRLSPLNPTAEEMPGSSMSSDAGAPVDYDRILADVAALRARVAAVSDNLYRSRVAVALENDASHAKIVGLSVSIDEGVVFTAPSSFVAAEPTVVYDHAVAPGRHVVTVDVERADERNDAFRTSQRQRFVVDVPRDHRVDVRVRLSDDSDMGKSFANDRDGDYDLRFRVHVLARPVGK